MSIWFSGSNKNSQGGMPCEFFWVSSKSVYSESASYRVRVDLSSVGQCGLRQQGAQALPCFCVQRASPDWKRAAFEIFQRSVFLGPGKKRQQNVGLLREWRGCRRQDRVLLPGQFGSSESGFLRGCSDEEQYRRAPLNRTKSRRWYDSGHCLKEGGAPGSLEEKKVASSGERRRGVEGFFSGRLRDAKGHRIFARRGVRPLFSRSSEELRYREEPAEATLSWP